MHKTTRRAAVCVLAAIAAVVGTPALGEDGGYEATHHADAWRSANPSATSSAHADMTPSGAFSVDAAADDDQPGNAVGFARVDGWGNTGGKASAVATRRFALSPGRYRLHAVVSGLDGSLDQEGDGFGQASIRLVASCSTCSTVSQVVKVLDYDDGTGMKVPSPTGTHGASVTGGRVVEDVEFEVPEAAEVRAAVETSAQVETGHYVFNWAGWISAEDGSGEDYWAFASAHAPGRATVQLVGTVEELSVTPV
jgi:hypothetical protein